jgi:aspartyl-tRNA(Asn)/glutamyl-tRNA(Gln) amidotransferase subunit B
MRSKEEAHDYRYFPDPDLLPLQVTQSMIDKARAELPELPHQKRERFEKHYGLSAYDAAVLIANQDMADYYESVVKHSQASPKLAANWVMGELSAVLNKQNLEIMQSPVSALSLAQLLQRIEDNTISGKIAKTVFEDMWNGEGDADHIISTKGLRQVTDTSAIEKLIDEVMAANPEQLADYRSGKDKLFGYFTGQVMKASKGQANPQQLNELLKQKLDGK